MWLFLTMASGHSMKWVWTCAVQRQCSIGGITGRDVAAKWEAMYIEIHGGSGIWAEWVRLFSQQQSDNQDSQSLAEKNSTGDGSWNCASVMEKLTRMIPCEHCMHCIHPQQTAAFTSYERNRCFTTVYLLKHVTYTACISHLSIVYAKKLKFKCIFTAHTLHWDQPWLSSVFQPPSGAPYSRHSGEQYTRCCWWRSPYVCGPHLHQQFYAKKNLQGEHVEYIEV